MKAFIVEQHTKDGLFVAVMAGMGRNKGTWDTRHGKRSAQRHAATLRREQPEFDFVIVEAS